MIAFRRGDLAVFLLGFAKDEQDNIDDYELSTLKGQARAIFEWTAEQFEAAILDDDLTELDDGH